MRIKKIETSVGVVGKITNLFSSSNKDTYSCDYINKLHTIDDDEQIIGTYFGKPYYRKIIYGNHQSSIDFGNNINIRNVYGICQTNTGYWFPINCSWSGVQRVSAILNQDRNGILIESSDNTTLTYDEIYIEYTKNDD